MGNVVKLKQMVKEVQPSLESYEVVMALSQRLLPSLLFLGKLSVVLGKLSVVLIFVLISMLLVGDSCGPGADGLGP